VNLLETFGTLYIGGLVVCSDQAEARRLKVKEARKRRNLRHEEKRKEKDREIMSLDESSKK